MTQESPPLPTKSQELRPDTGRRPTGCSTVRERHSSVKPGCAWKIGRAKLRPSMNTETNPRVVRWQGHAVAQLGFVNNTVLALTTASLGFAVSKGSSEWTEWTLWVGIAFLLLSGGVALCCAWNRLQDFRESAELARSRMGINERIARRGRNRKRGERTWTLLRWQLWTFALGAVFVVGAGVPWSKLTGGWCASNGSQVEPNRPAEERSAEPGSADTGQETRDERTESPDTP